MSRPSDSVPPLEGSHAGQEEGMYGVSAPFKQVSPRKVRRIVTNGVRSLQKCTLDQRSEVVGDPVGFRVRGRGMEAEGKLGGGGWWINLLGGSCGVRACVRFVPLASDNNRIQIRLLNE